MIGSVDSSRWGIITMIYLGAEQDHAMAKTPHLDLIRHRGIDTVDHHGAEIVLFASSTLFHPGTRRQ